METTIDKSVLELSPTIEPLNINTTNTAVSAEIHSPIENSEKEDSDYDTKHISRIASAQEIGRINSEIKTKLKKQLYGNGCHKWSKLFCNNAFCGRIFILFFSLFLFLLSIAYCAAQFWSVKLDLVKECDPKTPEEIWAHSYKSGVVDGEVIMNLESQYGHTNEPCMTTRSTDTNTDQLWFTNAYKAERSQHVDIAQFILFVLISLYCLGVIVYNIVTIISDIRCIYRNTLHTQSSLYQNTNTSSPKETPSTPKGGSCTRNLKGKVGSLKTIWKQYLSNDTSGWVIRWVVLQVVEIYIQTQAMLLYNGYNPFDPTNDDDIYLANKPGLILAFSAILAFNCFGAGILWLLYACAGNKCHGLRFELALFVVDNLSDVFYTIFPFIVVLIDPYNRKTNDIFSNRLILLGQLHMDSIAASVSAVFPLMLLCTSCLFLIHNTKTKLRDRYCREWAFIDKGQSSTHAFKLEQDRSIPTLHKVATTINWASPKANVKVNVKQIVLVIVSLIYIAYGAVMLILVNNHIDEARSHCNSVQEDNYFVNGVFQNDTAISEHELDLLHTNPELFLWDHCLVKAYPFTSDPTERCQCRVLVVDWSELQSSADQRKSMFNLTQNKILSGMLEHYAMLEKFFTKDVEAGFHELRFIFTQNMFKSIHMKAFEWNSAGIGSFESGISSWKELEYLKFEQTAGGLAVLPSDFGGLSEMKYLAFISSGISSFPLSVCNLHQLQVLQLEWETHVREVPHCVDQLTDLKVVIIDGLIVLDAVPLSIFHLPNLVVLSLFRAQITYDSLLEYNVPSEYIDSNDTTSIEEWMNDNFAYNSETDYYLSLAPICKHNITTLPVILADFITTENVVCDYLCDAERTVDLFCPPIVLGDGRCDEYCNRVACGYDEGDCIQLCFAPEIANCSLDKLNTDKCDEGCNNTYCVGYDWQATFEVAHMHYGSYECVNNSHSGGQHESNPCTKSSKNSIYLDMDVECQSAWIGDGECDDSCRTEECSYDLEDCSMGCVGDECSTLYGFWNAFVQEKYKITHEEVCTIMIPIAVVQFGIEKPENCSETISEWDYNTDKHLNFREFVSMAYVFAGADSPNTQFDYVAKGSQLNCSVCIGMEHYDI